MSSRAALRDQIRSLAIPPEVPAKAILGQRGKVVRQLAESTATTIMYVPESHRFDIRGQPRNVGAAAKLLERTVEHYQYSGLQFARKLTFNILDPELSNATAVQLLPVSRPVRAIDGSSNAFVLEPVSPATSRQQPGASTSSTDHGTVLPLMRHADEFDAALDQLFDLSTTIALRHPANCDKLEMRLYLGKLVLTDVSTSLRTLVPAQLLEWAYPLNGRAVFDTAMPQETVRSLDRYLTSIGLNPTQQSKSASIHLETSIPWIQYHPTFAVNSDGRLRLAKLETLGCKPLTVAMVGPANKPDVRMRFVASVQYGHEDVVAEEIRRRESEFVLVNNVQVQVPHDLHSLDLALTSARVKLKRVYTCSQPLPPPSSSTASASPDRRAARATTKCTPTTPSTAAQADDGLLPVSLKVAVAAVVDNAGDKRLEVTVSCPEINDTLMDLHRRREDEPPGAARELLASQMRSLLTHVQALRQNVEFEA